jgi:hypothetical protein
LAARIDAGARGPVRDAIAAAASRCLAAEGCVSDRECHARAAALLFRCGPVRDRSAALVVLQALATSFYIPFGGEEETRAYVAVAAPILADLAPDAGDPNHVSDTMLSRQEQSPKPVRSIMTPITKSEDWHERPDDRSLVWKDIPRFGPRLAPKRDESARSGYGITKPRVEYSYIGEAAQENLIQVHFRKRADLVRRVRNPEDLMLLVAIDPRLTLGQMLQPLGLKSTYEPGFPAGTRRDQVIETLPRNMSPHEVQTRSVIVVVKAMPLTVILSRFLDLRNNRVPGVDRLVT